MKKMLALSRIFSNPWPAGKVFLAGLLVLFLVGMDVAEARSDERKGNSETCSVASCHGEMVEKGGMHPDDASCSACHQGTGRGHPGSPPGTAFSFPDKPICIECHEEIVEHRYLHPPVAAGDCRACHNPHARTRNFLKMEDNLRACTYCHAQLIPNNADLFHGPLREGSCSPCHNPHGAPYRNLLPESFATDQFLPYDEREYLFCLSCHKKRFLQFPDTSYATEFRDGERNLHYLHVVRESRGKNCRLCHEIHAGTQPKLVAVTTPLGAWPMPLNFIKTETGGSCKPGCHGEQQYDRQLPKTRR